MKIIISLLFLLFITIGCYDSRTAKDYSCNSYSLACELKKDYIIVQPIKFSSELLDAYGEQLYLDAWYANFIGSNSLVPIDRRSTLTVNGGSKYYEYSDVDFFNGIKTDTLDLELRIRGLKKALLIMSGENEFRVNRSHTADLLKPKKVVEK